MLLIAIPVGFALAVTFAVARVYGNRPVSILATTIVGILRGFPGIITLWIIFFALPYTGIFFSPFWSAVLGLVLVAGAYQSEYVRGAIQTIGVGQSLAAQAVGMGKAQEVVHIILPQAIRAALPGVSNEILYLVLYSSLASYIGVEEMFAVARTFNSLMSKPMEIFLTTGLIYGAMATVVLASLTILERKSKIPGLEAAR